MPDQWLFTETLGSLGLHPREVYCEVSDLGDKGKVMGTAKPLGEPSKLLLLSDELLHLEIPAKLKRVLWTAGRGSDSNN